MAPNKFIYFNFTLLLSVYSISCYKLQFLGNFTANRPGFLSLIQTKDSGNRSDEYSLYISSFNGIPFTTDHIYYIPSIGRILQGLDRQILNRLTVKSLTNNIVWPNEVNQVPNDVFGKRMLSIASGFLVPFKSRGSIRLVDLSHDSPGKPIEITLGADDHQWFYHRVLWLDMNGDGRKDAVTCRGKKSILGGSSGQLIWYEHPAADRIDIKWNHHVIGSGSDTFFDIHTLTTPDGDFTSIVTTGYFSNQLKLYWTSDPSGQWTNNLMIKSRVIEKNIGHVFDVDIGDVNNDGKPDLLVTVNGINNGAVYVYEIPDDFRSGPFTRHTIMTGFHSHNILPGGGAPGSARTITNPSKQNGKPLILLSGDDDSHAYILNPVSKNASDWSYQSTKILNESSGTIGGITSGDIDGDGHIEIFVPAYSKGVIYVYKLVP